MMMRMIEVEGLGKRYGDRWAVEGLSFVAPDGCVTGFLGPNGAGKTTTFRLLLGLATASTGQALIGGVPYSALPEPRRVVGAVLESSGLHPGRSGRDHLQVIATAAGIDLERCDELLELVGLRSAAQRRVGGYSLGMRQRLSLATALLGDPSVIILDEPTNGLDPGGMAWLRSLMRDWAREGRCVVVASHLLAEVAQAVDRVVIVGGGRSLFQTDLDALQGARVTVNSADNVRLAEMLATRGATIETGADGRLLVTGSDAAQIGRWALDAGIAVSELTSRSTAEELERRFLDLTSEIAA
jgi:ABC-2 type transport system ATP-binding protein